MDFEFSLKQDLLTPIRPQKIEQLFSPCSRKPERILNDITYQVPKQPIPQSICEGGDTSLDLPDITQGFPRQSTCIKSIKQANLSSPIASQVDATVASSILLNTTNFNHNDAIPQYRSIYQVSDTRPIRATCFHPDGDVFVVGTNSKTLQIFMYPSEEELNSFAHDVQPKEPTVAFKFLQIYRGSVYCVSFNEQGNLLASGSNDQSIHIIKWNSKKNLPEGLEFKLNIHSGTVRDLCFLHGSDEGDSPWLVSGGAGENEIYLTDCKTMKPIHMFRAHKSTVMSIHSWSDPATFVSGSSDGTIRLWDLRSKRCASIITTNKPGGDTQADDKSGIPVGVVRVETTGRLLASGHKDGRCMFYDLRGGRIAQLFKAHDDEIRTLNFSPKSYYLLTGGYDHKIKLMDIQDDFTKKLPSVDIAELGDKIVQTAWHPHEYTFTTTSADGSANLWAIPELSYRL